MKAYLLRATKARGRRSIFKFRDDEEDERKTMRYSDSVLTEKRRKVFSGRLKFLIGFGNSACVSRKVDTYKTVSKK